VSRSKVRAGVARIAGVGGVKQFVDPMEEAWLLSELM
jgi:hypothetical protein